MRPVDFAFLMLICFVWSGNQILGRVVVSTLGAEPMFYTLVRCVIIVLCLLPIFRRPKNLFKIAGVGLLLSGISFGANFAGLRYVTPSAAAIVLQLQIPLAAVFSVALLGERIGPKRIAGIALAFLGVMTLLWDPQALAMSAGLLLVLVASFSAALGACLVKKIAPVRPLDVLGWGCLASIPLLALGSAAFDDRPVEAALSAGWGFAVAALASALLASVFAHATYFRLLQRYEANQIVSLTLVHPVMTILMGVFLTGDAFTLQMSIGTLLTLAGVFIVAIRTRAA